MLGREIFPDDASINPRKPFKIAASFGGLETLIEQPAIMSYFELSDEQLAGIGIDPALVRLSVGIEAAEDLRADLEAAFTAPAP